MFTTNISVFRLLRRQVGTYRAIKITLLKSFRRLLLPHAQFHFSQTGEDLILRYLIAKYLGSKPITYIDVGCNHPLRLSSSYLLYLQGSSGLAVDMNGKYSTAFGSERPRDVFVSAAVSDKAEVATCFEFSASEVNTISPEQAHKWEKHWNLIKSRTIQTLTLNSLVQAHLPDRVVDVLLIDVEGHELKVLEGADLRSMRPKLIACEIHDLDITALTDNRITTLLGGLGFRLVAYATMNAYFVHEAVIGHEDRSH